MGKVFISLGGGGGVGSDELTAQAAHVLSGKTFVGSDTNDEIGTGTMPNNGAVAPSALGAGGSYTIPAGYHNGSGVVTVQSLATLTASGDATAAQILSGKKAYVDGNLITGSMTDQGAKTSSLNCGGSYTIPAGYHNGSGKITANSLSSQTSANATAAQILKDKTAWVNGSKLTGTLAVTSAINFKATAQSATVIRISWTNPSKGPWEGVEIRMSTSGNPGVSGGTQKYKGKGNSATAGGSNYVDITGLSYGTLYYFTCTSYASGLGNGSSYNVSARTNDLVLYNGSSLLNGATWDSYNGDSELVYACNCSTLTNKKFVIKFKQTYSALVRLLLVDKEGYNNGTRYYKPDGSRDGSPSSSIGTYTWNTGTEYFLTTSYFDTLSSSTEIDFALEYNYSYGRLRSIPTYISYIAIRSA